MTLCILGGLPLVVMGIWITPAYAKTPLSWLLPALIDHSPAPLSGVILNGVSCASSTLCVAVDSAGNALISTSPEVAGSWVVANIDGTANIRSISCAPPSLCVAASEYGSIFVSTNPAGGATTWTEVNVDSRGRGINDVSCSSASFCVAVDAAGDILTSTNPAGGAGAWEITPVDLSSEGYMGANDLYAVSCAGAALCVAADFRGNFLVSANPTSGAGSWTIAPIDKNNAVYSVSCPASSLCVAGDWLGDLLTSADPMGGVGAWMATQVDPDPEILNGGWHINSVSCPTTSFCVAADQRGKVFTATDPTGGASAWTAVNVDGLNDLRGVSCPTISLCVAVDSAGNVVVGTAPVAPAVPARRMPLTVRTRIGHVRLTGMLAHGLPVTVSCSQSCTAKIALRVGRRLSRRLGLGRPVGGRRPQAAVIGHSTVAVVAGRARAVRIPISSYARSRLRAFSSMSLIVSTTAISREGRATTSTAVRVGR